MTTETIKRYSAQAVSKYHRPKKITAWFDNLKCFWFGIFCTNHTLFKTFFLKYIDSFVKIRWASWDQIFASSFKLIHINILTQSLSLGTRDRGNLLSLSWTVATWCCIACMENRSSTWCSNVSICERISEICCLVSELLELYGSHWRVFGECHVSFFVGFDWTRLWLWILFTNDLHFDNVFNSN
jgi:hypothetical protein